MNNDKIIINRNGKVITGIHDHHIYDLLYKNVSIGYFAEYYLENVVKSIEETGFFDGKITILECKILMKQGIVKRDFWIKIE